MWLCSSQRENYEYGTKQDQMWEWIWIFEKYFKGKIDFPKEKLFEFLCIDIVTKNASVTRGAQICKSKDPNWYAIIQIMT